MADQPIIDTEPLPPAETAAIMSALDVDHINFDALKQLNELIPGAAKELFDAHLTEIKKSSQLDEREIALEERKHERDERNDPRDHVMRILGTVTTMLVVMGAFGALIAGRHIADVVGLLTAFGVFIGAIRLLALRNGPT